MGELAATLLAELRKPSSKALWLLQVEWWDGTGLYSSVGLSSRTDGFYEALVHEWGEIREGGVDPDNNLSEITFTVTLIDPTGAIRTRLGQRQPIFNTRCILYLAGSESVPRGDWSTRFSGYLADLASPGRGFYTLTFRGLNVFSRTVRLNRVTRADWPNCPDDSVDALIPQTWGRLSGAGFTPPGGAVPTIYVDTTGFRYLVCDGRREVMQVYEAGVPLPFSTTGTNGFTVTYPIIGGRVVTVLDFASDQGSSAFTVDLVGPDSNGDGTGTVLETPEYVIDQALRLLSPIGASIIATPLPVPTDLHAYASFCLSTEMTGVQLVGALAQSFGLYPYLRGDGKVAFGAEADAITSDIYAAPWFRFQSDQASEEGADHAGQGPTIEASGQDIAAGQLVVYGKRPAGGEGIEVLSGAALSRAGSTAIDSVTAQMLGCLFEAEPDQVATLACWFEAWTLPHMEHGQTTSGQFMPDLSGNDSSVGMNGATLLRGECNGLPALDLDGTDDYLATQGAGNALATANAFTWFFVARINSVGTNNADTAVTNDALVDLANNTVGLYLRSSGNAIARNEDATPPDVTTKPWLTSQYQIFCLTHFGGDLYLGINDVRQAKMATVVSGATVGLSGATGALIGVNYSGTGLGTAFADISVTAGLFFASDIGWSGREIAFQILAQRYLRYPTEGLARAVGARRESLRQNLRAKVAIGGTLEALDVAPFAQVNLSDPDAFAIGDHAWQRRPFLLASRVTNPMTDSVQVELLDSREASTLWLSSRAKAGDPERIPGWSLYPNVQLEMGPGTKTGFGTATWLTKVGVEAPENDQFLIEAKRARPIRVGNFVAPIGGWSTVSAVPFWIAGGLALTSESFQWQTRSSSVSGTTGLTLSGGGITADPNDLLFPEVFSGNSLKLVVTGSADQKITWPAMGLESAFGHIAVDYKCDTGHYLELELQRAGDNWYFNASTGAFQSGSVWNRMEAYAGHAAGRSRGRFFLRPIPAGVATVTLSVRLPLAHGNGATAHVYHAQASHVTTGGTPRDVVDGYPLRSIADASTIISPAMAARLFNGISGESRLILLGHGTLLTTVALLWGSAFMHADHPLFELNLNTSGEHYLRAGFEYNGGSPRFAFRIRGGATAEVASLVSLESFQFGDTLRIACRWTSSENGELGLPALTATALVKKLPKFDRDGAQLAVAGSLQRGNDATYVTPTSNMPSALLLGAHELGSAADGHLDGLIQDLYVTPWCLSDEEISNRG